MTDRPKFAPGEGTVEEVPTKAGLRYRARIPTGIPNRRQNGPLVESWDEANRWRGIMLERFASGDVTPIEGITVAEFGETFVRQLEAADRPRAPHYRRTLENLIAPARLGSMPLVAVQRRDVRAFLEALPADYKPNTIKAVKTGLSAILTAAVEKEIIAANPAHRIRVVAEDAEDEAGAVDYLRPEEQRAVLACEAIPLPDRLYIQFAIAQGLRAGEQVHVPLADLEEAVRTGWLLVRYGSRVKGRLRKPKGGKTRRIPLQQLGREAAEAWLRLLPTFAPKNPLRLAFPTASGCRRHRNNPLGEAKDGGERRHRWYDHLRAAGIDPDTRSLNWHKLRHTTGASLASGWWGRVWALHEIRDLLGHSTVTVTEDYYGHLHREALARAAAETASIVTGQRSPIPTPATSRNPLESERNAPQTGASSRSGRNLDVLRGYVSDSAQWPALGLLAERERLVERLAADDYPTEDEARAFADAAIRERLTHLVASDPVLSTAAKVDGPHYVVRLLRLLDALDEAGRTRADGRAKRPLTGPAGEE